ncbi:MAG: aspartate kinase [Candidatus Aminicenantales bacterium]
MKVMKFGGGCLKDSESFKRAVAIIGSNREPQAVVVSATEGTTNLLIEGIREAATGKDVTARVISALMEKHGALIHHSISSEEIRADAFLALQEKTGRLGNLLTAVSLACEVSSSLRAHILSYGERLSALILSAALRSAGIPSSPWDSDEIGMVTDETCENATVDIEGFRTNIAALVPALFESNAVPVITGFFGRTPRGKVSTLGRNGSDYSASAVAAALNASRLEIWKDVDGFLSADPDLVANPIPIRRLSWLEAAELSYFGARILHPRTFEPLTGMDVSVVIKHFLEPQSPGTEILAEGIETEDVVKSVTANGGTALLRIHGSGVGFKPGVIGKIGRGFADHGINIRSVISSQTCINLLVDKADAARSLEEMKTLANGIVQKIELKDDIALIAVVGEGLLRRTGVAARVFSAVSRAGINIEMISTGASEVAAYFIVGKNRAAEAVNALHEEFFGKRG